MPQIPYETANPLDYRWTHAAYDLIDAGKLAVTFTGTPAVPVTQVAGPCPRCGDPFSVTRVLSAALAGGDVLGREDQEHELAMDPGSWRRIAVTCECSEPHEGRPDDKPSGCGITFIIEVDEDTA